MLTLNEQEEKAVDKIVSAIADYIQIVPKNTVPCNDGHHEERDRHRQDWGQIHSQFEIYFEERLSGRNL